MKKDLVAVLLCSSVLNAVAQEGGGPGGQPPPRPIAPLQAQNGKLSLLYGNGLSTTGNVLGLSAPTATVLGGIYAATAPANQFQTGNNAGVPTFRQPSFADLVGSLLAAQMPALTGDVSALAGGTATTINPGVVTASKMAAGAAYGNLATNGLDYTKLSQAPAGTYSGNPTGATANRQDMSAAQATAGLNPCVGDTGAGGTKGLVGAPAAGDAAAGKVWGAGCAWVLPPVFPVINAAALCDNSTNDTAAIQTALTAAGASTKIKTVVVPAGQCVVTAGTLSVPVGVTLQGQGRFATILKTNSATGDVLKIDGHTTVKSIGFDSSVTRTGGRYIFATSTSSSQGPLLFDLYMNKGYNDITYDISVIPGTINGLLMQNETPNATASGSGGIATLSGGDGTFTNILHRMDVGGVNNEPYYALRIQNGAIQCANCDFLQANHALVMDPGRDVNNNGQIAFIQASNSYWDTTSQDTVYIVPTPGGGVGAANFSNMWFAPNGSYGGVSIVAASSAANGYVGTITLANCTGQNYTRRAGTYVNVNGPVASFRATGNTAGNPNFGFGGGFVMSGVSNFQVNSNVIMDSGNNGVAVTSSASTNYMIQGNLCVGCVNATISDGGAASPKSVSGNL